MSDSTVLVVDDEEELAEIYAKQLSEVYTVLTANSGSEALELLDENVAVVLLDRRMPDMSGDTVLAEIRERDTECRVVMVTAVDPDVDIIEMDFDEYLVKPVTAEQLRDAVERMLVRDAQDEQIQEIVALASKLATLETKLSFDALDSSKEYQQLVDKFQRLRSETELPEHEGDFYLESMLEKVDTLLNHR